MAFKKHDWKDLKYDYNQGVISGEVIIKEGGRPIDNFIFSDNEGYKRTLRILKKYGFKVDKSVFDNTQNAKKEADKDIEEEINWLDKE
jgi:hypothetical protein